MVKRQLVMVISRALSLSLSLAGLAYHRDTPPTEHHYHHPALAQISFQALAHHTLRVSFHFMAWWFPLLLSKWQQCLNSLPALSMPQTFSGLLCQIQINFAPKVVQRSKFLKTI